MFDDRLKNLRIERNLNMRQASIALGMPYTTYVGYEKNEREPNSESLVLIANYFNVSVDYLIGRSDNKTLIEQQVNQSTNNNIIHSKRIELGISVKDFANAVGVSEAIVNQWEKGTISPGRNEIVKISRILNISIDNLLPKETALFVADSDSVNIIKNKDEILLLNNYKALNKLGKEKLIDYSDDLVSNGKYTDK